MAREFTDEQKKAWKEHVKEREDQAKEQIHDLARSFRDTPEQIQEFLTFGAKFYQYSARNTRTTATATSSANDCQRSGEYPATLFSTSKTFIRINPPKATAQAL